MQQEKYPSMATTPRAIRDRVGIFSEATDILDAIAKVREAEQAGVQQIFVRGICGQ